MIAALFHAGDVVQLKSGGPRMTFTGATSDGRLHCVWFDKNYAAQIAGFPQVCLVSARAVTDAAVRSS